MLKLNIKKLITCLIIFSILINLFGFNIKYTNAYQNPHVVTIPQPEPPIENVWNMAKYISYITGINGPGFIGAFYSALDTKPALKMQGEDMAYYEYLNQQITELEDAGQKYIEYVATTGPNLNTIILNNSYFDNIFVSKGFAVSDASKREKETKLDTRVTALINHLITPEELKALNYEGGEGFEQLNIKKILQQEQLSKEDKKTEKNQTIPVSSHYYKNAQAMQISGSDYIKCTKVIRKDDCSVDYEQTKAWQEYPIEFGNFADGSQIPGDKPKAQDNQFLKEYANSFHQTFANLSTENFLKPILEQLTGINTKINSLAFSNHMTSGPNLIAFLGLELLNTNIGGTPPIIPGYDFKNTIEETAKMSLYNMFNQALPANSFVGTNQTEWIYNIGRTSLSEKIFGFSDYLQGNSSEEILTNIGKRKFEDLLALKRGTLDQQVNNKEDLLHVLGQGTIEQRFNLKLGSFTPNNINQIKQSISEEKYNQIFQDTKMAANMLGISHKELEDNINNPQALKRIIGQSVINQNIDIYPNYQIPDSENTINSRDLAFDTENYLKPYIDFEKNKIITRRYSPQAGIETNEYPFDPNSQIYQNLIAEQQKNSIVNRFTNANNLSSVFKETGIDALTKKITNIEEEREYLRVWLTTGAFPSNLIDAEAIGSNVGLQDRYDIARIFAQNRANEVYERIGKLQLEIALNPSLSQYYNNYGTQFNTEESDIFIKDKLNQIKSVANNIKIPNTKETILVLIDSAINAENDSKDDIITDAKKRLISRNLYNIGTNLKPEEIKNSQEAQEINNLINQVITLNNLTITENPDNISYNTEAGITNENIKDLLSGKKNIDEFKLDTGKQIIAGFLGFENTKKIDNALKSTKGSKPISNFYEYLKPDLEQKAKYLNYSLYPKELEKLGNEISGWNLANILSGNQEPLIKIASSKIASNLQIPTDEFTSFLKGNIPSISNKFDLNQIIPTAGQLYTPITEKINSLVDSMGKVNFTEQIHKIGQGLFPNNFAPMPDNQNQEIIDFYNNLNDQITKLFNGEQTQNVASSINNLINQSLGQAGIGRLFSGDSYGMFLEKGVKDMQSFLEKQLPNEIENININRWLNNLSKAPEDAINKIKNEFAALPNLDKLTPDLVNKFAKSQFSMNYAITQSAALLKLQDTGFNKQTLENILSGNPTDALKNYLTNWTQNSNIPFSSQIQNVVNGTAGWSSLNTEAQNILNNKMKGFLGFQNMPDNMSPAIIGAINGKTDAIKDLIGTPGDPEGWKNNLNMMLNNGWDNVLGAGGLSTGAVSALSSVFSELNSKIGEFTTLLLSPVSSVLELLNLQKIIGGLQTQVFGLVNGVLAPVLGPINQAIGLTSGFIGSIFNAMIPGLFSQLTNIFGNLTSNIIGSIFGAFGITSGFSIGIDLFGFSGFGASQFTSLLTNTCECGYPKEETWCAMDYYPYLDMDIESQEDKYVYNIPFEPEFDKIEPLGLDNTKSEVGDWSGSINDNLCCTEVGCHKKCGKIVFHLIGDLCVPFIEWHGKGEFKMDSKEKLNSRLNRAAKFKITQLTGALLRVNDKFHSRDMLPRQVQIPDQENDILKNYTGRIDRLYGITTEEGGKGELVTSYLEAVRKLLQFGGVWANNEYPFVYISY